LYTCSIFEKRELTVASFLTGPLRFFSVSEKKKIRGDVYHITKVCTVISDIH
jgi:hypothetical protein